MVILQTKTSGLPSNLHLLSEAVTAYSSHSAAHTLAICPVLSYPLAHLKFPDTILIVGRHSVTDLCGCLSSTAATTERAG